MFSASELLVKKKRQRWKSQGQVNLILTLCLVLLTFIINKADARPYLVFASKRDVRIVEVASEGLSRTSPKTTIVVKKLEDVAGLDFFLQQNKICWTEISLPAIRCSVINPGKNGKVEKEVIVDTGLIKPEGLACDWINNNIYWTDTETKRIEVASLPDKDGLFHRNVLVWEDLSQPRAIAVSPSDGLMFWTDWGSEYPKIERSSMDGNPESRKILVDTDLHWPNGLTLDYESKLLYWIDANLNYIAVVDWDGNNRRVLFQLENSHAFAISVYRSELYWTDWNTNAVHLLNLTEGTSAKAEKIKLRGKLSLRDIKVFEPMRQNSNESSGCSRNNGGCSHLCLAATTPQKYACSCPRGIQLIDNYNCASHNDQILILALRTGLRKISLDTPDFSDIVVTKNNEDANIVAVDFDPVDGFIYWTDLAHGLNRISLDGFHKETIVIDEVYQPDGIAVDHQGRNLFWTDNITKRIEVIRLDGKHRKLLISHDLEEPRDITLDLKNGYIYWSDWGSIPRIERAWMDGSHRQAVVTEDIVWPNGIALDVDEQKIYWCDAKMDRIEVADVDGSNRKIIVSDFLQHPFGLSILGDYIYWTDWEEKTVERARKNTGEDRVVLVAHLDKLMDLQASVTSLKAEETNECSLNNGGCSHLCFKTPQGRQCACPNGYELAAHDELTCVKPDAFLLFVSSSGDINRSSLRSVNNGGPTMGISGVTGEAGAIDADFLRQQVYWTDIEEKTINRGFINGTNKEVLVEFGLDIMDGLAIDWISQNIYWTDTGLHRIEVARTDGKARKVLIWDNLDFPVSIVLDPVSGVMFWSAWGKKPVIETAALDGTNRRIFVPDVGKANGLTIDFSTRRLYWTDFGQLQIAYATLDVQGYVKPVVQTASNQIYGLAVFKDHMYWADWDTGVIEKANKDDGLDREIVQKDVGNTRQILIYQDFNVSMTSPVYQETNPCAIDNGGCSELCLFNGHKAVCQCSSHQSLQGNDCFGPSQFILFGQKNKISRLIDDPHQVPDLVLPVQGARDIRSIAYDSLERMIYWIDYGSKKHQRISINRAYDNGTLVKKTRLLTSGDSEAESQDDSEVQVVNPHDIAIDSYHRLLFWNDETTNMINVLRIKDDEELDNVGRLLTNDQDKPRAIALHAKKALIFWVNAALPIRIESSRMDGSQRKTVIDKDIGVPTDLTVDGQDDLIFWADIHLKRLESSDLSGNNRKVLVNGGILEPLTFVAVQDQYIYWAVRHSEEINRVNKFTGEDKQVVKSHVHHLSSLIAVQAVGSTLKNPCQELECSHFCLIDQSQEPHCSCPYGSGLVLGSDGSTCGAPPTCKSDEFTCNSGNPPCIPFQWRCDSQMDCGDSSDEIGCSECTATEFRCRNSDCVNASLICDTIPHCKDASDEIHCCPRGKFQCTVTKECIDESKTCNGISDCKDGSDESIPQCANQLPHQTPSAGLGGGGIAVIIIVIVFIFIGVASGIIVYRKRTDMKSKEHENPRAQGVGAETNTGTLQGSQMGTLGRPLATSAPAHRNRVTSSNAQTYDRSHVTGASSSTASSHNGHYQRDPPPSVITDVNLNRNPRRIHQNHHQSMHSLGRPQGSRSRGQHGHQYLTGYHNYHVKPHPPTPASTDINDVSESDYGHFESTRRWRDGGGYDSEYGGVASRPHPPTPRTEYDVSDYYCPEEVETLVYPEAEEIAYIPPPPCNTPPPEFEENDM